MIDYCRGGSEVLQRSISRFGDPNVKAEDPGDGKGDL